MKYASVGEIFKVHCAILRFVFALNVDGVYGAEAGAALAALAFQEVDALVAAGLGDGSHGAEAEASAAVYAD